jgi:hypothetical protein
MNLDNLKHAARLAVLLPLVVAAGCTGSDMLTPTTGSFKIQVEVVNVPEGYRFGDSDGDRARFRILQIRVQPADPRAAEALGDEAGMAIMRFAKSINHHITEPKLLWDANAQPPEYPPPLSSGTWILKSIEIDLFNFKDNGDPPSEDSCEDYITTYRTNEFDGSKLLQEFGQEVTFNVEGGVDNQFSIVIDWEAFSDALQASWPCYQNCGDDPWCLQDFSAFQNEVFYSRIPDFLSFE